MKERYTRRGGGVEHKARILLDDLDSSCDHECAMRGGMIRAVQSENVEWYRKFCAEHESNRKDSYRWSKFKTKVKRQDTRRGLQELIAGKCESYYAKDLQEFIRRWEFEEWQMKVS